MDFKLQSVGPFLHWVTLGILCVIAMLAIYLIYRIGKLPGDIARSRHHPQATAISVCAWMGVITLVLWPLALIWAYLVPDSAPGDGVKGNNENDILIKRLHDARQRLAMLEHRLSQSHPEE